MHGPLAPLGCSDRDHRDEQKHAGNGKQKSFDDWHRVDRPLVSATTAAGRPIPAEIRAKFGN
jgi:hypothetical protein